MEEEIRDDKNARVPDIDNELNELKALIMELAYNNPYDDSGSMIVDNAASEMELYSEINSRINGLRVYIHKLQKDVYIYSEMAKVLKEKEA